MLVLQDGYPILFCSRHDLYICSNYLLSAGIVLDYTCDKYEKKPNRQKFFGNRKSYELSAHIQLSSFEYIICRFLGKLEFQIKSDVTRAIKLIKHVIV